MSTMREQSLGAEPTAAGPAPGAWRRAVGAARRDSRTTILLAGLLLVAAQLGFRAWALLTDFFYYDDYSMLIEARERPIGFTYLFDPWSGHLMPAGRLWVSAVEASGSLNWTLVALSTLLLQLVASLACLWMLVVLFGRVWGVLPLLALYLWWIFSLPALLWWAATLNQLGMQVGFFLAIGAWVRYLREDRLRWAAVALAGVGFGLAFDIKALLIVLVMAYVAAAYFATGSAVGRVLAILRSRWRAVALAAPLLLAYVAFYALRVEGTFATPTASDLGGVAQAMLGTTVPSGLVGGPWDWSDPYLLADPPPWTVHLAWVVLTLVVGHTVLRRERAGRAWGLLLGYVVVLVALLATSRVPSFGPDLGLEYRYTTELSCVAMLCLGLACLPVRGALESSRPRDEPLLRLAAPAWLVVGTTALVCVSGVVSSVRYVDRWEERNVSADFMAGVTAAARQHGSVDVADRSVGDDLLSGLLAPDNRLEPLVGLATDAFRFPDVSSNLAVLSDRGELSQALIEPAVTSQPGPEAGCGWRVDSTGLDVPLTGDALDWEWWVRIGYLASADSAITVTAGDTTRDADVQAGVNSLFVRVEGTFDAVRLDGLDPGVSLCVDSVEVGEPVAGGAYE